MRANGAVEEVVPFSTIELGPGDEVIVETPSGGYGVP